MFSQGDEGTVESFKVYKDPIVCEADVHINMTTVTKCDAAPLADASNILKQTRPMDFKSDTLKKPMVNQEKLLDVTEKNTMHSTPLVDEDTIPNSPEAETETETETSLSENADDTNPPQATYTDNINEESGNNQESDQSLMVENVIATSPDASSSDTNFASHHLDQADSTTEPSNQLSLHESDNAQAAASSASQDSQEFGDDIEFDSQTLERIQEIESSNYSKPTSTPSKATTVHHHEETEEDFGPDFDADVLESIENKASGGDKNFNPVSDSAPEESYEEITSWLEEFDDMDDMFDVDLDGQLPDNLPASKPQINSPTESSLESLLQSSELDTQKILAEVNNITSKYGGFLTGSKKPLATALSSEAVANLFEKKSTTSSKKTAVNKSGSIRPFKRTTTPKARSQFGGFVNARTNSALHASESAKRKAAKAFGEEGQLVYQITDTEAPASIEGSSQHIGKSQKLSDASN
jgi:hypothetical protein